MKNKGFTIVELLASFILTMTVVVFLFEIILELKNVYVDSDLKTRVINSNALVATSLNNKLDKELAYKAECDGSKCKVNGSFDIKIYDNYIQVGNKKIMMPTGSKITDGVIENHVDDNLQDTSRHNAYIKLSYNVKSANLDKKIPFNYIYTYNTNDITGIVNVNFKLGKHVQTISSTNASCKITEGVSSCHVNLPSITKVDEGYNAVGYSKVKGDTVGLAPGTPIEISESGLTYYANAIDNIAPIITFEPDGSEGSILSYGGVKVNISDKGDGLKNNQNICYAFSESKTVAPASYKCRTLNNITNGAKKASVTIPESDLDGLDNDNYLWIKSGIVDVSGNASKATVSKAFSFDGSGPEIVIEKNSDNTYERSKRVNVIVRDIQSGLSDGNHVEYGFSKSLDVAPTQYKLADLGNNEGDKSVTFVATESGLTGEYYLWVKPVTLKNVTGIETTGIVKSTGTYKFDNTKPANMTLSKNSDDTYTRTKDIVVTLKDVGGAGLTDSVISYGFSTSDITEPEQYEEVRVSATNGNNSATFSAKGEGLDGEYYLWVKPVEYKDKVGNRNSKQIVSSGTYKFDNTIPTNMTVSENGDYESTKSKELTVTISDVGSAGLAASTFKYGWSKDDETEPTNYATVTSSPTSLEEETTFKVSGNNLNGSLHLWIVPVSYKDKAGNENTNIYISEEVFAFDSGGPKDYVYEPSDGHYKRGENGVTVTLQDNGSAGLTAGQTKYGWSTSKTVAPTSYTTVDTDETDDEDEYQFTASMKGLTGIYYLWIVPIVYEDKLGNKNTNTVISETPYYIDNTDPTLDFNYSSTTNSITVVADGNDADSGVKTYGYRLGEIDDSCKEYAAEPLKDEEGNIVYDDEGNAVYECIDDGWIYTTDNTYTFKNLNHDKDYQVNVMVIDNVSLSTDVSKTVRTKKLLPPTYSQNSKVVTITYPVDCSKFKCSYIKDGGGEVFVNTNTVDVTFNTDGTLVGKVNDDVNTVSSSYTVSFPRVSINPNSQSSYVSGGKAVVVTLSDSVSGLKAGQTVSYAWSTSSSTEPTSFNNLTTSNVAGASSTTVTIPASASSSLTGTYYLWIKGGTVSNVAGTTNAKLVSGAFKFDNKAPSVSFSPNTQSSYTNGTDVMVTLADNESGLKAGQTVSYAWSTSSSTVPTSFTNLTTSNTAGAKSATVKVPASVSSSLTGTYYLWVKAGTVSDVSGNKNAVKTSGAFKFDSTAPTVSLSPNTQSSYTNGTAVTVTLADNESGLKAGQTVSYAWSTSSSTAPTSFNNLTTNNTAGAKSTTVTVPASVSSSLTGTYYLWIKAGTAANVLGNKNAVKTSGAFKFDDTAPTVSLSPASQSSYAAGGKAITVTLTDNESGLKANQTVSYAWSTSGSTVPTSFNNLTTNNTAGAKSTTVTVPASVSSSLTGTYYLWIKAGTVSNVAGGKNAVKTSSAFKFDNKAPTVSLSPSAKSSYTNGTDVTVTLADNESGLKASQTVSYAWSTSSSTAPTSFTNLTTNNTAGVKSATVKVPASVSSSLTGTYYLWVKAGTVSDVSGNKNAVKTSGAFKFDNAEPTVSLSTSSTTNSITVVANASAASGISKYEYSINGGAWVTGTGNTYTFTGLIHDKEYPVKVRVTSGVGKMKSVSGNGKTDKLTAPTFSQTVDTEVTINYPAGCGSKFTCTYEYNDKPVVTVTSNSVKVPIDQAGGIVAKVTDGKNSVSSNHTVLYNELYVASTGSDSTGYGTKTKPYATTGKAYTMATKTASIYVMDNITSNAVTNLNQAKNITLTSYSTTNTINSIIKGSGQTSYVLNQTDGTLNLKNITIDGNNVESQNAMVNISKSLVMNAGTTLQNAYNTTNVHSEKGGAISVQPSGTLTINDGTIKNNKAVRGGGINNLGTLYFKKGSIIDNKTTDGAGAGIWSSGDVNMSGGTISGNVTNSTTIPAMGGGINITYSGTDFGNLTITGGTISNNTASSTGGGIYANSGGEGIAPTVNISGNTTIENNTANVSGGGIYVHEYVTVNINGGVIKGNLANGNPADTYGNGGAIASKKGAVININDGEITNNRARGNGGAIHVGFGEGNLTIKGGTISHNVSGNSGGGVALVTPEDGNGGSKMTLEAGTLSSNEAIHGSAIASIYGTTNITGGTIQNNVATSNAAVYNDTNSTLTVKNVSLLNNTATDYSAGAIYNRGTATIESGTIISENKGVGGGAITNRGTMNIKGGTISKNRAVDGLGGEGSGGAMANSGHLTISAGTISDNIAEKAGGGILNNCYSGSCGIIDFVGGSITNNKTTNFHGGGMYIASESTLNIKGGTISGNTAATYGGGVICQGTCTMTGGTISGNKATSNNGGGVSINGKFTLNGGTIKNNTAVSSGGVYKTSNGTYTYKKGTVCGNRPTNSYETATSCS